ncbi:MAG: DUF58 domain-containing protein [Flavobacteriales bacterium]|nr:DUF58 domain-containing protein [Flavobacteriales bacterium]|tara:strand:- start:5381 stop:6244 length:864 start_codon:yes stop_codon:yes gene_type:complete
METSELLKKVRKIEIKTKRLTNNLFTGQYHSAFKGKGMVFSEVRKYVPGDDVRDIDWNVTAKLSEPYIKIFEEERELTMMLMVDVSKSEFFGSSGLLKKDLITEICAVLSFSAMQNNDKVGVIFFTDDIELFIPPKKGKKHILRIIRELINFTPNSNKTNISKAFQYLNNVVKKKSIVFMLSDFIDDKFDNSVRLIAKKHDLTGIRVFDKFEEQVFSMGLNLFYDTENELYQWIDTSDSKVRNKIQQKYNQRLEYFRDAFLKSGASIVNMSTQESYIKKLLELFKSK